MLAYRDLLISTSRFQGLNEKRAEIGTSHSCAKTIVLQPQHVRVQQAFLRNRLVSDTSDLEACSIPSSWESHLHLCERRRIGSSTLHEGCHDFQVLISGLTEFRRTHQSFPLLWRVKYILSLKKCILKEYFYIRLLLYCYVLIGPTCRKSVFYVDKTTMPKDSP